MIEPNDLKEAHFEFALRRDGFTVERKTVAPSTCAAEHAHPFDVRALILNGEITLTVEGIDHAYREGDIFVVPAGLRHAEAVGPEGVAYLVGRKAAAPLDAGDDASAAAHGPPAESRASRHRVDIERARA
jgi:quercetin dioxygenase-like cupin family protein